MRYIVIAKELPLGEVEAECRRFGGRNIKVAKVSKQVFCELEEAAADKLRNIPGLVVKTEAIVKTAQLAVPYVPPRQEELEAPVPVFAASQTSMFTTLYNLRAAFVPPLIGTPITVAIIDTGIRSTHIGLLGKVVYEENFTDSDTVEDVFNHGTGVAYLIAGGTHALGVESGVAPGASLMNLKAIGDDGLGTDEMVIMALERVYELWAEADANGVPMSDPTYPNVVNMSLGQEDDEDEDNPMRVAVKEIVAATGYKLILMAAAGNAGPGPGTIMLPAACYEVTAVGAVTFVPFQVWYYSSRGPVTVGGLVKPDLVYCGINVLTASAETDESFIVKSGTSFSCGVSSGFTCLFGDFAMRYNAMEQLFNISSEQRDQMMLAFSAKPEGALLGKDNDYGIGMPMGHLLLSRITSGGAALPQVFNTVIGIGMIGAIMPMMTR